MMLMVGWSASGFGLLLLSAAREPWGKVYARTHSRQAFGSRFRGVAPPRGFTSSSTSRGTPWARRPARRYERRRPEKTLIHRVVSDNLESWLADLVPPPRKHRHRYHGVSAPNHRLRRAVTALAIGNIGKRREAATGGQANDGHGTGGGGVSPAVPEVRRRHPADCVHHQTRASDQTTAGRSRPTLNRRFASGRRPGWLRPTSCLRSISTASDR